MFFHVLVLSSLGSHPPVQFQSFVPEELSRPAGTEFLSLDFEAGSKACLVSALP